MSAEPAWVKLAPMTRELYQLHRKRLEVPEFAKWWARYVHMKMSAMRLQYTEEELALACEKAFAALPPDLRQTEI